MIGIYTPRRLQYGGSDSIYAGAMITETLRRSVGGAEHRPLTRDTGVRQIPSGLAVRPLFCRRESAPVTGRYRDAFLQISPWRAASARYCVAAIHDYRVATTPVGLFF